MLLRVAVLTLLTLMPSPALAWGFDAHRYIVREAVARLPPELRAFFGARQERLAEHSVEPDRWRSDCPDEAPRHFLNLDAYGGYPFAGLPRTYDEALAHFGRETVHREGLLPWRTEEIWVRLREAFRAWTGDAPGNAGDVTALSGWLAHYVSDAHVPLHAVLNYDGQLTGQRGVHARFETALFNRFVPRLRLAPGPVVPVTRPREAVFEALLGSFRLAEPVLAADRLASRGLSGYDEEYFERFFRAAGPLLEQRLSDSVTSVAAFIAGAWEAAGRPVPPADRR